MKEALKEAHGTVYLLDVWGVESVVSQSLGYIL